MWTLYNGDKSPFDVLYRFFVPHVDFKRHNLREIYISLINTYSENDPRRRLLSYYLLIEYSLHPLLL